MTTAKLLPFPPHWVNAYLFDKLGEYGEEQVGISATQTIVPFIPTMTTGTDEIYQQITDETGIAQPTLVAYDRLMRFRTSPFYGIKREQILYTIQGSITSVNNINVVISQLLDREDAAAQDINNWAKENPISLGGTQVNQNVFFHNFRVYQVDETRDLIELASVNLGNTVSKIIVEYDYHANWTETQQEFK